MKKLKIMIFVLGLVLCCGGCEKKSEYKFLQDISAIDSIEIVEIGEFTVDQEIVPMTTICIVDDKESFLKEFLELNCYCNFGDPQGVMEGSSVIKIIYNNGEFELIDIGGQSEYTHERGYRNYVGFRYFDENQFCELLLKYCNK